MDQPRGLAVPPGRGGWEGARSRRRMARCCRSPLLKETKTNGSPWRGWPQTPNGCEVFASVRNTAVLQRGWSAPSRWWVTRAWPGPRRKRAGRDDRIELRREGCISFVVFLTCRPSLDGDRFRFGSGLHCDEAAGTEACRNTSPKGRACVSARGGQPLYGGATALAGSRYIGARTSTDKDAFRIPTPSSAATCALRGGPPPPRVVRPGSTTFGPPSKTTPSTNLRRRGRVPGHVGHFQARVGRPASGRFAGHPIEYWMGKKNPRSPISIPAHLSE